MQILIMLILEQRLLTLCISIVIIMQSMVQLLLKASSKQTQCSWMLQMLTLCFMQSHLL